MSLFTISRNCRGRLLLFPLLFWMFMTVAGCQFSNVPVEYTASIQRFYDLLNRERWSEADKENFIDLFTIQGLNQFLESQGWDSFAEFERRRSFMHGLFGAATFLERGAKMQLWSLPSTAKSSPTIWAAVVTSRMRMAGTVNSEERYLYSRFVFVKGKVYSIETLDTDSFKLDLSTVKFIYPGSIHCKIYNGVKDTFLKEFERLRTPDLNSPDNATLASSLKSKALADGAKGNIESYQSTIKHLHNSLASQFDPDTLLELAYFFSCLGQAGRNPELNFIRALYLLDFIEESRRVVFSEFQFKPLRWTAVKIINDVNFGNEQRADELKVLLPIFKKPESPESANGVSDFPDKDERILEAGFLLEQDWRERLALAEELIHLSPGNPRYYNYKGLACYHIDDMELAKDSFERAIAQNNAFNEARKNLEALRQKAEPKLGIGPSAEKKWETEPEDFPFRDVAVYADLLQRTSVSAFVE